MHLTPDMEGRSTNRLCAEARASFWALHVERGSNSSGPAAPMQPVFAAREPCLTPNILCPLTPLRVSCDSHTHSVPPRASAARGACCHLSSALLPALPHPTVPWGTSLMKTQGMRMASQVPNCPAMCYMPLFCPRMMAAGTRRTRSCWCP